MSQPLEHVLDETEFTLGDKLGVLAVGLFIVVPMAIIMNIMLKVRQWLGGE